MVGYGIVKREKPLTVKDLPQASYITGMKGVFIGDSLIEVNYRTDKGLLAHLSEKLGITTVNKGTSGYGWSTQLFNEMLTDKSADDANFIYIALGINDWWNVSTWGLTLDQVRVYINFYLKYFRTAYPNKPIIVATPMPTTMTNNDAKGAGGYTLAQLVDVIKEEAKAVDAFILDMYSIDPLGVKNVTAATKDAFLDKYFTQGIKDDDGVHPNDAGWAIISRTVADYINHVMLVYADRKLTDKIIVESTKDGIYHLELTTFPNKDGVNYFIEPQTYDINFNYFDKLSNTDLTITIGDTVLTDATVKDMGGLGVYNNSFYGTDENSEYKAKFFNGPKISKSLLGFKEFYAPVKMIVECKLK